VDEDDGAEGAERGSGSLLVCERDQSGTSDEQKQEITQQVPSTMDILSASPNQCRRFSLSSSHTDPTPSPPCSLPTVHRPPPLPQHTAVVVDLRARLVPDEEDIEEAGRDEGGRGVAWCILRGHLWLWWWVVWWSPAMERIAHRSNGLFLPARISSVPLIPSEVRFYILLGSATLFHQEREDTNADRGGE
jgi:hypothetical protein